MFFYIYICIVVPYFILFLLVTLV